MKKAFIVTMVCSFLAVSIVTAHADLDTFLGNLNVQAHADLEGFGASLSTQFNFPLPKVQAIIESVKFPADAFMCLQLSRMANCPPDRVLQTYKHHKKNGWGAIAKELGIKPGSDEFKALKRGDFHFTQQNGKNADKGKKHGKGKGHDK